MDLNPLIVKQIPSVTHDDVVYRQLGRKVDRALTRTGLPETCWTDNGRGRLSGANSKEGDMAFKPRCRHKETDWPTIVIECELSQSLARDAHWWINHSIGGVNIVVLISVDEAQKTLKSKSGAILLLGSRGSYQNIPTSQNPTNM
jgi:hypothetical protein